MKFYILLFLSILCFFSCNQNSVSENQKPYFTEGQKAPKESVVVIDNSFDFDDYNDTQLDSIFRLSLDSMVDFLNVTKFEKDTIITNYFSSAMYGQAKFGFPEFVILDSKYLYAKDSADYDNAPMYIYVKNNNKFELSTTIMTTMMSWTIAEVYRQDINFDDKVDLIISRPLYMASRSISVFHIFTKQNLKEYTHIVSTHELLANDANKTVISFADGSNFGTNSAIINEWKKDSLVRVRQLDKTVNYQKEGFIVEEFRIKKDKKTKIKSQILTQDEADKYLENYK